MIELNVPDLAKRIGSAIRSQREKVGVSIREAARRSHQLRQWWWNRERGITIPSLVDLIIMAVTLECEPLELLRNCDVIPGLEPVDRVAAMIHELREEEEDDEW